MQNKSMHTTVMNILEAQHLKDSQITQVKDEELEQAENPINVEKANEKLKTVEATKKRDQINNMPVDKELIISRSKEIKRSRQKESRVSAREEKSDSLEALQQKMEREKSKRKGRASRNSAYDKLIDRISVLADFKISSENRAMTKDQVKKYTSAINACNDYLTKRSEGDDFAETGRSSIRKAKLDLIRSLRDRLLARLELNEENVLDEQRMVMNAIQAEAEPDDKGNGKGNNGKGNNGSDDNSVDPGVSEAGADSGDAAVTE